jgi:hypothetical protein
MGEEAPSREGGRSGPGTRLELTALRQAALLRPGSSEGKSPPLLLVGEWAGLAYGVPASEMVRLEDTLLNLTLFFDSLLTRSTILVRGDDDDEAWGAWRETVRGEDFGAKGRLRKMPFGKRPGAKSCGGAGVCIGVGGTPWL